MRSTPSKAEQARPPGDKGALYCSLSVLKGEERRNSTPATIVQKMASVKKTISVVVTTKSKLKRMIR